MSLSFRKINEVDASILLAWRTDPDITRYMYTDLVNPTVEKQIEWIKQVNEQDDYQGFIIQDDGHAVGYLSFNDINQQHLRCSTGSYIYDKAARLKYAATLHTFVCNYAFECLGMNKIENYIMDANKKVIKLQKLHKSHLVGCLREHIFKNGAFHDVYVFETLKSDWHTQKQHFDLATIKAAFETN